MSSPVNFKKLEEQYQPKLKDF